MQNNSWLEQYACRLGRIYGNLMSLETSIRAFLGEECARNRPDKSSPKVFDFERLRVGDVVPADPMTDFSALDQLVRRYNAVALKKCPDWALDRSLIDMRDALAHGRHFTEDTDVPLLLLKFSKVTNGTVKVECAERLTEERMREWAEAFFTAIVKVTKAADFLAGRPDQTADFAHGKAEGE